MWKSKNVGASADYPKEEIVQIAALCLFGESPLFAQIVGYGYAGEVQRGIPAPC